MVQKLKIEVVGIFINFMGIYSFDSYNRSCIIESSFYHAPLPTAVDQLMYSSLMWRGKFCLNFYNYKNPNIE